ncbi:MAG: ATP-binding protein, partial [Thiovulaceae bacterium]|nr:ATP-binding protein [Sulfurimonadaceae bacterium]
MDTLFVNFNKHIDLFETSKKQIIDQWVNDGDVRTILDRSEISSQDFAESFAYDVLEYFLNVARGDKNIGDCPVMAQFLQFLRDKDITASELFVICSKFRKSMVDLCFAHKIIDQELYHDIALIFDKNFAGVLESFGKTIKEAEIELVKTQQLLENYKTAIDAHSLISLTDTKGVITYVNDAFCRVSGYTKEELIGKKHNIIRHEDMSLPFFKSMWATLTSGEIFHDIIKNKKKNGETYYVDTVIVPLLDTDGTSSGYISVRNDITANIATTENALLAEEAALEAKELAQAAEKSKDDFLAAMSHEIRTPLNAILGFVAILFKSDLPKKEKDYLGIIDNSGQALLTIINDILDFAKIRSGKFEIDNYECDPTVEVENILDLFSSKMLEKGIEFIPYIDPSLPATVSMDGVRVRQIVSNYLSNAVKFTPEEGLVYVRVLFDVQTEVLSIYVQDSGIGIKKENIDKVFGAFSQEEGSTSRKYGGTGLGLSISKDLAKLMHGSVGVDSIEGQGSTFYLHIPVTVVQERKQQEWVKEIIISPEDMNAHQYKLLYKYCQ